MPASRSSSSTVDPNATALAAANKNNSSSGTSTGAIAGGVVGGVVALALLAGLLVWCFRRRSSKHPQDFDPFSNDDPWDPAARDGGAGGHFSKADEFQAYSDGGPLHHSQSALAGAGAGLAGAGVGAGAGAAYLHGRNRSDASHEKADGAFYAPVSSSGSPPRRASRRKAPPSAEQDMYYATGRALSSDGHSGGGEYGYGGTAYDDHLGANAYGHDGGAGPYAADPYAQAFYAPQQQHQQQQVPYGQPGGLMQYPGQGAPTYPPAPAPSQGPTSGGGGGGIPYHQSSASGDQHQHQYQEDLLQEHLADSAAATPGALVPGQVSSPAPSHRSIPHLGAMSFEHPDGGATGGQGPGGSSLRVVNEEDPYGGIGGDDGGAAAYYQQQPARGQYGYGQQR